MRTWEEVAGSSSVVGADHPLSVNFGRPEAELLGLLQLENALGLAAAGVAFHVGSQQRNPGRSACSGDCRARGW